MSEELERSAQLKLQANAAKLAQSLSAKQAAKAKELETTVGTSVLLQDYQVSAGLRTRSHADFSLRRYLFDRYCTQQTADAPPAGAGAAGQERAAQDAADAAERHAVAAALACSLHKADPQACRDLACDRLGC